VRKEMMLAARTDAGAGLAMPDSLAESAPPSPLTAKAILL